MTGHPSQPDDPLRAPVRHMTQVELARRWRVSTRTLERWRIAETGPVWLRINNRILYRVEDVLAYESIDLRPKD